MIMSHLTETDRTSQSYLPNFNLSLTLINNHPYIYPSKNLTSTRELNIQEYKDLHKMIQVQRENLTKGIQHTSDQHHHYHYIALYSIITIIFVVIIIQCVKNRTPVRTKPLTALERPNE